jgi:hypothetical protein
MDDAGEIEVCPPRFSAWFPFFRCELFCFCGSRGGLFGEAPQFFDLLFYLFIVGNKFQLLFSYLRVDLVLLGVKPPDLDRVARLEPLELSAKVGNFFLAIR